MSKKYTADEYISMINNSLMAYLSSEPSGAGETKMLEAMRYSVENGGKRIRPMLTLEFCRMCGGSVEAALPLACAIEFIHKQIVAERDRGTAVLLVSLELDEVMDLSDRILVMYEGEIVGEFDPKKVTVEELGLYMAGAKRMEVK